MEQAEDAKNVLENSAYLYNELRNHFPDIEAKRGSTKSNTIYFRRVNQNIVKKWTLATVNNSGTDEPSYAHVVIMPHASPDLLDRFLSDMEKQKHRLIDRIV